MFCALVQWLCYAQLKLKSKKYGRRRNQRRKPKQKEISKSNTQKSQYNATMPLYDSRSIAEISFLRRLTTFQSPVGLFELEFCSTGTSVSFSSSLAGFAALCKLRYGPPSTVKSKEGHGPSLLVAVETDTRSVRIVRCSCFRLRGRKHGHGEHTA